MDETRITFNSFVYTCAREIFELRGRSSALRSDNLIITVLASRGVWCRKTFLLRFLQYLNSGVVLYSFQPGATVYPVVGPLFSNHFGVWRLAFVGTGPSTLPTVMRQLQMQTTGKIVCLCQFRDTKLKRSTTLS